MSITFPKHQEHLSHKIKNTGIKTLLILKRNGDFHELMKVFGRPHFKFQVKKEYIVRGGRENMLDLEDLDKLSRPGAFSTLDMEVIVPDLLAIPPQGVYLEVGVDKGKSLS